MTNIQQIIIALVLVLIAYFSRFIPHPVNFTPVLAIMLFSGVIFRSFWINLAILFLPMFASDLWFGLHSSMPFIYLSYALIILLGYNFREFKKSGLQSLRYWSSLIGLGLGSAMIFFLISNLGVWLVSGMYSVNLEGLLACFTNAIPFFRNTLSSTLVYAIFLFAIYEFATARIFNKKSATNFSGN